MTLPELPAAAVKDLSLEVLEQFKAEDIVCTAAEGIASYTDYLILATGRSTRHQATLAEKLRLAMKQAGVPALNIEGQREASWILLDFDVVVIHLQTTEKRQYYDLEGLWFSIEASPQATVENTANIAAAAQAALANKAGRN